MKDPRCLAGLHADRRIGRTDFLITGEMFVSRYRVTTWWECSRCGRVAPRDEPPGYHATESPRDRYWYHPGSNEVDYGADSRGIGWTVDAVAEDWTRQQMEDYLRERAWLSPCDRT